MDQNDSWHRPPRRPYWTRAAIYALPLVLMFVLGVQVGSDAYFAYPRELAFFATAGPLVLPIGALADGDPTIMLALDAGVWLAWLALVSFTRVGRLAVWIHALFGLLWCASGIAAMYLGMRGCCAP